VSSHAAPVEQPRALARRIALPRVDAAAPASVAFGTLLAAVALEGQGGLQLGPLTTVEIALELLAGIAGAAALLLGPSDRRPHGALVLAVFAVLLAFTAASIGWAINPDDAWIEANRTLAWLATFALGIALVRIWPERWTALLGGFVLAAVVVCGYAVLTKVFPGALNPDELVARLREPFGYWNSVGLMSAMAGPACLWLGARRSGHAALNALAYPAFGLLVVALLLAYSRGALLVLGIGCAFWFAVVPLRLRGVAVLATGGFGGLFVGLWAFSQDALSQDRVPLAQRVAAGHDLGILVLAMLLVVLIIGLAVGFSLAERAPSPATRRRLGLAVLVCVALVPVAVAGLLATSEKGFGGSISSGWRNLTDPNARIPANDPTRLAAVGSVRARYWDEALKIWRADEAVGAGAGGYRTARPRFRRDTINVRHAHGYVVQTLADLGLVGLAVNLALLAAWLAVAARNTGLWGRFRRAPYTPERIGLLTMAAIVLVFGAHSTIDWTWIVPGNVVPALLFAGWVAGRGPVAEPFGVPLAGDVRPRLRAAVRGPWRVGGALAALAVAGIAAWTTYQPQRSVNASNDALEAVEANKLPAARADVRRARAADPLSTTPLYAAATIESRAGNDRAALRLYEQAVRKQPASSETWLRLAQFELDRGDPRAALRAIGPALYLDPRSVTVRLVWLDASRAEGQRRADAVRERRAAARNRRSK
jgi:O-Antigen ligase/Tetratricopeptide repeat